MCVVFTRSTPSTKTKEIRLKIVLLSHLVGRHVFNMYHLNEEKFNLPPHSGIQSMVTWNLDMTIMVEAYDGKNLLTPWLSGSTAEGQSHREWTDESAIDPKTKTQPKRAPPIFKVHPKPIKLTKSSSVVTVTKVSCVSYGDCSSKMVIQLRISYSYPLAEARLGRT